MFFLWKSKLLMCLHLVLDGRGSVQGAEWYQGSFRQALQTPYLRIKELAAVVILMSLVSPSKQRPLEAEVGHNILLESFRLYWNQLEMWRHVAMLTKRVSRSYSVLSGKWRDKRIKWATTTPRPFQFISQTYC
jgi:hypothetical protein